MSATLRVIGVGPGDPELITLKAARAIAAAPVIAYFCKTGKPGHARTIAAAHIAPAHTELRFEYPFTTEREVTDHRYAIDMAAFYESSAGTIAAHLNDGRDVALLCEGDPFFYGSSMYLFDRLARVHATDIIPGVTGMSGCWTRAHTPMTHGDDILTVLPGTLDEDTLAARLREGEATVIMKLGRNLTKIRAALARTGLAERAIYVERGTMSDEVIRPFAEVSADRAPYFALVLIPGRQGTR
jgi:precorrin-2/cobalt-factor-2 C20-methyltransferase